MAVVDWDATPANNVVIDGINIAEGCTPSGMNNAIRSVMGAVKAFWLSTWKISAGTAGTITIQADGGALPGAPAENDILIEYTP